MPQIQENCCNDIKPLVTANDSAYILAVGIQK